MKRAMIGLLIGTGVAEVITMIVCYDASPEIVRNFVDSGLFFMIGFIGAAIGTLGGIATQRVRR